MYYIKALGELLLHLLMIVIFAPFVAIILFSCEVLDAFMKCYYKLFHRKEYEESISTNKHDTW